MIDFIMIGSAHWHAPWHLRGLEAADKKIVAASDPNRTTLEALFGERDTERFSDWRPMVEQYPDAVVLVLSPPDDATEILDWLADHDRPFAVEKPATVSADTLRPAAEKVAARGIPTSAPLINRYASFWGALAEVQPGKAVPDDWSHAHFHVFAGPPQRYLNDGVGYVLDPLRYGGGVLRNLGIHALDAVAQLTNPAELVIDFAMVSNRVHGQAVEDFASATMHTPKGQTITLEAGYSMPTETTADKEWRIHGSTWAVAEANGTLAVRGLDGIVRTDAPNAGDHYMHWGRELAGLLEGTPQIATVGDLLIVQDLVDRVYAAA